MKRWTNNLRTQPIKHTAASIEAASIRDLYTALGAECDEAIGRGADAQQELRTVASRIGDKWTREGFVRLYKILRPEHFEHVAPAE